MRAIRQYEFGGPEVLHLEEVPDLVPTAGLVRIAAEVSGVHFIDTAIRSGATNGPLPPPQLPMTPGREVAGRIDRLGDGVDESWLGTRVVAHLGMANGGYAEQALTAVESVHLVPEALPFDVAVAAIGTGRTAVGILDQAPISVGDTVLVTAAAGGLGALLTQAAKHAGATVVGLAGGQDKVAVARSQGADLAVDYRVDGWDDLVRRELGGDRATLVFDGVAGKAGLAAYGLLAPGGTLVQYGWASGEPVSYDDPDRAVLKVLGPQMGSRPGGIRALEAEALVRAADGSRVPLVGATFALSDASGGHRAIEARATHGKVVLIPDNLA
ncbi:MAG: Oxidoreductase [Aeromicrobium sp.]|nr:Oxidoreductase [Aeromicrobium sp.]